MSSNTEFSSRLNSKLLESLFNNYGAENFDQLRFGSAGKQTFKEKIKDLLRKKFVPKSEITQCLENYNQITSLYGDALNAVYNKLNEASRQLFTDIIAFRILGYKKVKLPLNNSFYRESLEKVKKLKDVNDSIDPNFMHFILERFDLKDLGYDIELYFSDAGIVIDFIIEQYSYKIGNQYIVQADKGDVVLDIGACWGDTALYFSHKVGDAGKVYSFEFIPNNIALFNKNINLNPKLKDRISIVERPVSETSDRKIFYRDFGPGSKVADEPFENQTGSAETLSIDDFVAREKLSKVDFIKMDIEGAEPFALKGAINTIKKFRPKLAVAVYHSLDDFVNIPKWIDELDLNYEFYLGHYTIHAEESVLFAAPK